MAGETERTRIVIMGTAGRDFHNFNVVYRNDPRTEVVAFTAPRSRRSRAAAIRPRSPGRFTWTGFPSWARRN